ncbi:tRNA (guanine37-N(1)-) methyltransferase [Branchiibius hedensis]|uniref:tRNA (guanine-N(1)-)-methyltransferase n=1 Tax=Branchiibius hedensis TaxID=672460 RepID=A0A2Y8ZTV4_9MICO|nr:tRNA (guanosine(37)-N1)-methyltransferase TrmD [Branchiibius hedensis]PWJ25885.1 tRNA (guanine37-N(1)-) methyltransferase [Branchiibius hedensis]SSA34698.1 tRNA (Guanine37-N(1)-) methyltransferase [Branchiibius hedensis]
MQLDVISIFPDYLAPLDLSLIGKARRDGLIDLRVHDLRDFTHDRHRTVDDTPYGGGAGMVMKPQPWSEALDHVAAQSDSRPVLIVPGPGGQRFDQATARDLAAQSHLVFACGRYEGIDERVYDYAARDFDVRILSLGDYVLNGGDVAVLAMVEAIARLIPGVIGNADSLVEESHEDGLLEYPVYTKPADWHGRRVPEVLLSGDHAKIAAWRHAQRLTRTAARRPDLLPAAAAMSAGDLEIRLATPADVGELLTLTHACWLQVGINNNTLSNPAQHETVSSLTESLADWQTYVARSPEGRMVGSVRVQEQGDTWFIARLMVAPDLSGRGIGRRLLEYAETSAPAATRAVALATARGNTRNLKMYQRAGFRPVSAPPGFEEDQVYLRKSLRG